MSNNTGEHYAPDPTVFQPQAVSAETHAFNKQLVEIFAQIPPIHETPAHITRAEREAGRGAFGPIVRLPQAKEWTIPGPGGALTVRVFRPRTVNAVYLHMHSGGWTLSRAHHFDHMLLNIATRCHVAVVSVDYRLAPEDPYPAAPDDCEAAATWLIEHAAAKFGTERLLIGGESAGAHLAAVTLLRMRDRHGYTGFKAANLLYGMYDLRQLPGIAQWGEESIVINQTSINWFLDNFVPAARRGEPDVSPLLADLREMPPALFTVGTFDPLLDDSLLMHARWVGAGNQAELAVYPGGVHAFNYFPYPLGQQAMQDTEAFISRHAGA